MDQKALDAFLKSKHGQTVSGSEAVLLSILSEGSTEVFGYPGGAIMPIYDELYKYEDKLKHYLVRHEQGAVHAAQGYARVSGKTGVCMATSGPGATNLITGIADAQIDSTPIVCITGQVASHLLGTDAFQETDVIGISMPVTKWNYQITHSDEIQEVIAKAFFIAKSGRPGPTLIDITKDAQFAPVVFKYKACENIRSYHPYPKIDENQVKKAAKLINEAKKPFLLIGQGIILSHAEKELKQFVEKSGIPVASTLLGLGALPENHPLYMGYLGMHGNYGPNIKTNECDVLVAIGMRFDDRVTGNVNAYAKQAKVIHVDIDPAEINKIITCDAPVISDAKVALKALHQAINSNAYPEWLDEFKACDAIEKSKVIERELSPKTTSKIKMAEVLNMISEKTKGEAIIVTDVGQHQMIASRYYQFNKTRSCITSGGLGTMGFALPAAIGAATAEKKRPVIAVIGDGGFQMTIQELGAVFQYNIPVKIIVLNNSFLGMVRQWQQLFFDKRYASTEMVNPNFCKIAEGYNIENSSIDNRNQLENAVDHLLDAKGPIFLEIKVEREGNVFPMVPTGASVSEIRLE